MQVGPALRIIAGFVFYTMRKNKDRHRRIYRKVFGIKWDGTMYDIHHINEDYNDNSPENLILLPKPLHCRLHAIYRQSRLDTNKSIHDFILEAYFNGADGVYLNNIEWFSIYAEIVKELAFWGKMKMLGYRSELSGDLLPIEGITSNE